MKKILFPMLILIGGILTIIALYVVANRKGEEILVIREQGAVYVKKISEQDYTEVTSDETSIESGTYVKTGSGKGHVLFPNNSLLTLDQDTEIQVTYSSTGIDIVQFIGKTWNRVRNIGSGAYKVNTPTALATVRGTILGVEVTDITDIYVVESTVDVQQKEENGKLSEVKSLVQGKKTSIKDFKKDRGFGIIDIPEELKQNVWFLYNRQLDGNHQLIDREELKQKIRVLKTQVLKEKVEFQVKIGGDVSIDTTLSDSSCTDFSKTATYFDQRLAQMKARGIAQKDLGVLQDFRNQLEKVCADGTITRQEAEILKQILSQLTQAPAVTTTPTQSVRGVNTR
jgi:Txe/YoeB family toxin of Txe-Axe toxin-antitoxin module